MKWKEIKLGDTATFINGYPFKPSDWSKKGKEIIRIQNLTKSSNEINRFEGDINSKYLVRKGDLLISWSATLGIYEWDSDDAWVNQHIFKVAFDKTDIDKVFFKYLIKSKLSELSSQVHGATMKHITKDKFDNTAVHLPPLAVQREIAELLDKADALHQKDQLLLQKYDELAQSIFYDMFGDPVTNEKGWEVKTLGSFTDVGSGSTPSRERDEYYNGTIPWVKTTEVKGTVIFDTEEKITDLGLSQSSCRLFEKHSIVIAMYGQGKTRGNIGLLGCDAATNQACAVIKPSPLMETLFLFNQLKFCYDDLRALGRGGNQANLNIGMIKDYQVISPPLYLQQLFVRRIQIVSKTKDTSVANSSSSQNLFASLLKYHFN